MLCECGCGQDAGVYKRDCVGGKAGQPKRVCNGHQALLGRAARTLLYQQRTQCTNGHALEVVGGKCKVCSYAKVLEWNKANPLRVKAMKRKSRYGITEEEYQGMLSAQDNKCKTCRREFGTDFPPEVDHCHKTQMVRALLCHTCNMVLGLLGDRVSILENLIKYLKETQSGK